MQTDRYYAILLHFIATVCEKIAWFIPVLDKVRRGTGLTFGLCQGVSYETRENVDESIDRGTVSCMFQAHVRLELIKESFNNEPFVQQ